MTKQSAQPIQGIGGSVVEYSPATRVARVRFPADAICFGILDFSLITTLEIKGQGYVNDNY